MQINNVEYIHNRIKSELDRLGLSMAEAARTMGEADSQGLRDVCSGRKRASAELIAKLLLIQGVDIFYILTGGAMAEPHSDGETTGATTVCVLTAEEKAILESYRLASETGKRAIAAACSILAEGQSDSENAPPANT